MRHLVLHKALWTESLPQRVKLSRCSRSTRRPLAAPRLPPMANGLACVCCGCTYSAQPTAARTHAHYVQPPMLASQGLEHQLHSHKTLISQTQSFAIGLCPPLSRWTKCDVCMMIVAGAGSSLTASASWRNHPGIHPRPATKLMPTWNRRNFKQPVQGSKDPLATGGCSAPGQGGTGRSMQPGLQRGGLDGWLMCSSV